MAFLAAVPLAYLVGAGIAAGGSILQGVKAKQAANTEADQLENLAGQEQAGAQRAAHQERHEATLVQSRARAVAAASGGGVTDPTVQDIMADIGTEGEYRALTQLYSGDERALELKAQALATRKSGKAAQQAGFLTAASSLALGGSTLYAKYGGRGPPGTI